jgi:DNA polymerase III epsilon subunit-like protein
MKYPAEYSKTIEDGLQTIYFVDLETTGLDAWQNETITLSMSVCDLKERKQLDEIELQFRPEAMQFWGDKAEEVHRITKSRALTFPPRDEGRKKLLSFFEAYKLETPQLICCHALSFKGQGLFDWNFLRREFDKVEMNYELDKYFHDVHSTVNFAKELQKKGKINLENNKLDTICRYFDIPLDHHDAKSDRLACQEIYWRFLDL